MDTPGLIGTSAKSVTDWDRCEGYVTNAIKSFEAEFAGGVRRGCLSALQGNLYSNLQMALATCRVARGKEQSLGKEEGGGEVESNPGLAAESETGGPAEGR